MTNARAAWASNDIQAEYDVEVYDQMQRRLCDKGWMQTQAIIDNGLDRGHGLELGCGPGYLGLDWLRKTDETLLTGLDINDGFIVRAGENAERLGLLGRARFMRGDGDTLPFDDGEFDAVFSSSSLHEWEKPVELLNELHRVLKPGGACFVSDHRRDMPWLAYWFMWFVTKPASIREGLHQAIRASYTEEEAGALFERSAFGKAEASSSPMGLTVVGRKVA